MSKSTLPGKAKAVCSWPGMIYSIERDGVVIALALRMVNGTWSLVDKDTEARLSQAFFRTPKQAADAADKLGVWL